MPDIRGASHESLQRRENVCIDSYRILDSCKDKDCFEDTKLMLTDYAQEVIDKSSSVRVAATEILWSDIPYRLSGSTRAFTRSAFAFIPRCFLKRVFVLARCRKWKELP